MVNFEARVKEFFTKELGFSIKHIDIEPSTYIYPLYRVIIADDEYAMTKVVDFTENDCKFTAHSKAAIHHTADFTFEWQNFNIEKSENPKEKIAFAQAFLQFCENMLEEKTKDFLSNLATIPEFETALNELNELCDHVWKLENTLNENKLKFISGHNDEVALETETRSRTIRISNILTSALEYLQESPESTISPEEQAELLEAVQTLKEKNNFNGNYLIYKMDVALGYIGGKEQ